jgi:hypothetical protein
MTDREAVWATSEEQAAEYQRQGYRPSRMHEVACNHNEFALLLVRDLPPTEPPAE